MDDKEKQLLCTAQALLPTSIFEHFSLNFKELLENTGAYNWNLKLLNIFALTTDNDKLTERLFEFFESCNLKLPDEFYFAPKAHKLLDNTNYKSFMYLMAEYVDAKCHQEYKQLIGSRMMEIIKTGAGMISIDDSPKKDGVSVKFQAFREFQFWFEMFLNLKLSRYKNLVSMVRDYKRALTNEDREECTREIVMVVFGLNENLTKMFLDFFAPGSVNHLDSFLSSVRQYYQKPNSRTFDYPSQRLTATFGRNYQFRNSGMVENLFQVSTAAGGQNYQFLNSRTVENPSQVSTAMVRQNYQFQNIRTVENPSQVSTAMVRQNYQFQNIRTVENPFRVSAAMVRQNCPFQNIRTVENPSQVSTATVGQRLPFLDPSIITNLSLPSEFSGIISEAHQLLDKLIFRQLFKLMLEYVDERATRENRNIIGRRMMEIISKGVDMISRKDSPPKDGVSVKVQDFRKLQFWFDMFLTLNDSMYLYLVSMVRDYTSTLRKEDRMECARKIVMVVFGLDKNLTKKFLDVYAPESVKCLDSFLTSVRKRYKITNSRTLNYHPQQPFQRLPFPTLFQTATGGPNYLFLNTRTMDNPYHVLTNMVERKYYTFQNTLAVGNPSQVSTYRQRYPFPRNQDHSTTAPDTAVNEPNHQILSNRLHYFQPFVSEAPIGQNSSILNLLTSGKLSPVERKNRDFSSQITGVFSIGSAAPAEHKIPDQEAQTADYLSPVPGTPINFLTRNPPSIESSSSDLGFGDSNYLLSITTGAQISNNSSDLLSVITAAPAESQCLDQETRTADYPHTVPATPIKSPIKNPSPVQSPLPNLASSVPDLPESNELFDAEFMDHSSLWI